MGRASGKKTPRLPLLDELLSAAGGEGRELTEGERREAGVGETRDIPGGLNHLGQDEVVPQKVPVPDQEWPFYRSDLAHGVPPDEAGHHDRIPFDRPAGGQRGQAPSARPSETLPSPVPVYIVEKSWRDRPTAAVDTRRITLPAAGSEPAMICGANPGRALVQMLNENGTHHARFGQLAELGYDGQNGVITGGARLPAAGTAYTVFRSQDELYATSEDSTAVVISVILESETP